MAKNYNDLGVAFKYLIVNDMDRKFGLWVNTVGFQSIGPGSPYPLRDHPSGYYFDAQKGRVLHEYQIVYIMNFQTESRVMNKESSIGISINKGTSQVS